MRLLKEGQADAFYSAGNSGAMMAAIFVLDRIEGVHRPAIGAVSLPGGALPPGGRHRGLRGAPPAAVRPAGGVRGARLRRARPRVGLVSNGEEETKGNALVQATHPLLKASGLNFVGNVEGKDVTNGLVDVAVCDGFTGNVMLKTAEGVQELIFNLVREAAGSKLHYRLAGAVLRPALRAVARRLDYAEVGGALDRRPGGRLHRPRALQPEGHRQRDPHRRRGGRPASCCAASRRPSPQQAPTGALCLPPAG